MRHIVHKGDTSGFQEISTYSFLIISFFCIILCENPAEFGWDAVTSFLVGFGRVICQNDNKAKACRGYALRNRVSKTISGPKGRLPQNFISIRVVFMGIVVQ